ncbi:MAG: autotransporter outer membrane beta-barrel domain-containing protein, partial [Rickettsiales bacterium]|nr:autotransporter outer membrane beta-barrel domain-containing protein [Rickettsiales bacterium]
MKKIFILISVFLFIQEAWSGKLPWSVSSVSVNSSGTAITLSNGGGWVLNSGAPVSFLRYLGNLLEFLGAGISSFFKVVFCHPLGIKTPLKIKGFEESFFSYEYPSSGTRQAIFGAAYVGTIVVLVTAIPYLAGLGAYKMLAGTFLLFAVACPPFLAHMRGIPFYQRIYSQSDRSLEFGHFVRDSFWILSKRLSEGVHITPYGVAIRGKFRDDEIVGDDDLEVILLDRNGYSIRFNNTETASFDDATFDSVLFHSRAKYDPDDWRLTFPNGDAFTLRGRSSYMVNDTPLFGDYFKNGTRLFVGSLRDALIDNMIDGNRESGEYRVRIGVSPGELSMQGMGGDVLGIYENRTRENGQAKTNEDLKKKLPLSVSSISVNSDNTAAIALSNGNSRMVNGKTSVGSLKQLRTYFTSFAKIIIGYPAEVIHRRGGVHFEYPPYRVEHRVYAAAQPIVLAICISVAFPVLNSLFGLELPMWAKLPIISVFVCAYVWSSSVLFDFVGNQDHSSYRIHFQPDGSLEFGRFASSTPMVANMKLSEGVHITPDGVAIRGRFRDNEIVGDDDLEIILLDRGGYSIRFNNTETASFDDATFDGALFHGRAKYDPDGWLLTFPNGDVFRGKNSYMASDIFSGVYSRNGTGSLTSSLRNVLMKNIAGEDGRKNIVGEDRGENIDGAEKRVYPRGLQAEEDILKIYENRLSGVNSPEAEVNERENDDDTGSAEYRDENEQPEITALSDETVAVMKNLSLDDSEGFTEDVSRDLRFTEEVSGESEETRGIENRGEQREVQNAPEESAISPENVDRRMAKVLFSSSRAIFSRITREVLANENRTYRVEMSYDGLSYDGGLSRVNIGGVSLGYGLLLERNYSLSVFLSVNRLSGSLEGEGPNDSVGKLNSSMVEAGIQGRIGSIAGLSVNTLLYYGHGANGTSSSSGKYSSQDVGLALELGYRLHVNGFYSLRPSVRLSYLNSSIASHGDMAGRELGSLLMRYS